MINKSLSLLSLFPRGQIKGAPKLCWDFKVGPEKNVLVLSRHSPKSGVKA